MYVFDDGTAAMSGANVDVHYGGVAWSNGQQFDSSTRITFSAVKLSETCP